MCVHVCVHVCVCVCVCMCVRARVHKSVHLVFWKTAQHNYVIKAFSMMVCSDQVVCGAVCFLVCISMFTEESV